MSQTQATARKTAPKKGPRPWIKSSDQVSLLVLTGSLLVMSCCYWWYHDGHRGGLVEIDRAEPRQASYLVDINSADRPEIIQLPSLGETLAQRIIEHRNQNGLFRNLEDLKRVDGIGPKTLELIRPYLQPIPRETDWAAASAPQSRAVAVPQ